MDILQMKSKIIDVHSNHSTEKLMEDVSSFANYHMSDGFSKNVPDALYNAVNALDAQGRLGMRGNGLKIYGWCKKKKNVGVVIYTDEPYEDGEYSLLMMKYLYLDGVVVEGSTTLALEKVFWALKEDPLFEDLEDISFVNGHVVVEWKNHTDYVSVDTSGVYTILRDLLNGILCSKNKIYK